VLGQDSFNRAAVIAEVRAVFEQYEAALARNDVELLNAIFLHSATTVRFGIAEQDYGFEAIAAYRRTAAPVHPQRRLLHTVISSFGADLACVCCEFSDPSTTQTGRQTQTWVRTGEGWRIAAAHVSLSNAAP
jgi:ketosteroid isomerase-like protein